MCWFKFLEWPCDHTDKACRRSKWRMKPMSIGRIKNNTQLDTDQPIAKWNIIDSKLSIKIAAKTPDYRFTYTIIAQTKTKCFFKCLASLSTSSLCSFSWWPSNESLLEVAAAGCHWLIHNLIPPASYGSAVDTLTWCFLVSRFSSLFLLHFLQILTTSQVYLFIQ